MDARFPSDTAVFFLINYYPLISTHILTKI